MTPELKLCISGGIGKSYRKYSSKIFITTEESLKRLYDLVCHCIDSMLNTKTQDDSVLLKSNSFEYEHVYSQMLENEVENMHRNSSDILIHNVNQIYDSFLSNFKNPRQKKSSNETGEIEFIFGQANSCIEPKRRNFFRTKIQNSMIKKQCELDNNKQDVFETYIYCNLLYWFGYSVSFYRTSLFVYSLLEKYNTQIQKLKSKNRTFIVNTPYLYGQARYCIRI